MKIIIIVNILLIFSACSNTSVGAYINNNGHGGTQMQGDVLKF